MIVEEFVHFPPHPTHSQTVYQLIQLLALHFNCTPDKRSLYFSVSSCEIFKIIIIIIQCKYRYYTVFSVSHPPRTDCLWDDCTGIGGRHWNTVCAHAHALKMRSNSFNLDNKAKVMKVKHGFMYTFIRCWVLPVTLHPPDTGQMLPINLKLCSDLNHPFAQNSANVRVRRRNVHTRGFALRARLRTDSTRAKIFYACTLPVCVCPRSFVCTFPGVRVFWCAPRLLHPVMRVASI